MRHPHDDIVIADCCGGGINWQYMRVATDWHLLVWVQVASAGDEIQWRTSALPAHYCHECGRHLHGLDAIELRRYFRGIFEPVDEMVNALKLKAKAVEETPDGG